MESFQQLEMLYIWTHTLVCAQVGIKYLALPIIEMTQQNILKRKYIGITIENLSTERVDLYFMIYPNSSVWAMWAQTTTQSCYPNFWIALQNCWSKTIKFSKCPNNTRNTFLHRDPNCKNQKWGWIIPKTDFLVKKSLFLNVGPI